MERDVDTMESSAARRIPRPRRTSESKAKILATASELLIEKGYAGFTIEAIVARSGVAKTTIYRHWPSRSHLASDVIGRLGELAGLPDTGSIEGDVRAFLADNAPDRGSWDGKLENISAMLDAAKDDPGLGKVVENVREASLRTLLEILERGRGRGEIAADRDLATIAKMILGAAYFEHGHLARPLTEAYVGEVVDIILRGCRPT